MTLFKCVTPVSDGGWTGQVLGRFGLARQVWLEDAEQLVDREGAPVVGDVGGEEDVLVGAHRDRGAIAELVERDQVDLALISLHAGRGLEQGGGQPCPRTAR